MENESRSREQERLGGERGDRADRCVSSEKRRSRSVLPCRLQEPSRPPSQRGRWIRSPSRPAERTRAHCARRTRLGGPRRGGLVGRRTASGRVLRVRRRAVCERLGDRIVRARGRSGSEREKALDYLENAQAQRVESSAAVPIDPSAVGWGWVGGTPRGSSQRPGHSGRSGLARPSSSRITDAVALLRDRESVGGGWNYGNREVLGEELPPFAQTTAVALIGLAGSRPGSRDAGPRLPPAALARRVGRWPVARDGDGGLPDPWRTLRSREVSVALERLDRRDRASR